jgi:hypothetical protein
MVKTEDHSRARSKSDMLLVENMTLVMAVYHTGE